MKTIFVYKTPSEASEILNNPEELELWATVGYFPRPSASAPAAEPPVVGNLPATPTLDAVNTPPEGAQTAGQGSNESATPPDGKPAETGSAPAAEPPVDGGENSAKG